MHRTKQKDLSDKCFCSQDISEIQVAFGEDSELIKFELQVNDDSNGCLFIYSFFKHLNKKHLMFISF